MATRAGTLTSETIPRPGSSNLSVRVRVGVRFAFKLLIQSRTPVSEGNTEKRLVRILYMIHVFFVRMLMRMLFFITQSAPSKHFGAFEFLTLLIKVSSPITHVHTITGSVTSTIVPLLNPSSN